MHPTPGCRLYCPDNYPIERSSADLGARVITVDRPGFGRSDVHDDQGLDGAAWDRVCLDTPWGFSAAQLRTETIVWSGDRDEVLGPAAFDFYRTTIPGARAVVWEGDGHRTLARGDRWGEVLEAILEP